MLITLLKIVLLVAAGFVAGVLVGRKNKKLVETAVAEAKELESKVKSKIKKK